MAGRNDAETTNGGHSMTTVAGRLEGRTAIITGAARGTGAATARRFVREGARVVVGDIRDRLGSELAEELGAAAIYAHLDVTSESDWAAAVELAEESFGGVQVLVNNAAVLHIASLADTGVDAWNQVVAVNQTGPFLGIKAVIEPMVRAGGGSIVNISSIDGLEGMNGVAAYASTKWALRGLTRCAALELGRMGIRVNTVCPAGGSTEMSAPWRPRPAGAATGQEASVVEDNSGYTDDRAIPRRAELDEIVNVVLFLASDEASFCTGADYAVDGGHSAGSIIPVIPPRFGDDPVH